MSNTVIQEWTDEKGWVHRLEIPLTTFLIEHDLEPVVRCKDCKYYYDEYHFYAYVMGAKPNGYCHMGKRREDE